MTKTNKELLTSATEFIDRQATINDSMYSSDKKVARYVLENFLKEEFGIELYKKDNIDASPNDE